MNLRRKQGRNRQNEAKSEESSSANKTNMGQSENEGAEDNLFETPVDNLSEPEDDNDGEIYRAKTTGESIQETPVAAQSNHTDNEQEQEMPTSNQTFDPHDLPRKERDYAMDNSVGEQVIDRVAPPESDNLPPVTNIDGDGTTSGDGMPPKDGDKKGDNNIKNPELRDLDKEEKTKAAKVMAEVLVDAYSNYTPAIFKMVAKTSEKKMDELSMKGEVDFTIRLPMPSGDNISAKEYLDGINNQADQLFEVSEDFKKNIVPPLTRILAKKEMGMTDEQLVAWYLANDLIARGKSAYELKTLMKGNLEYFKAVTLENNGGKKPIMEEMKTENSNSKTTSSKEKSIKDVLNDIDNEVETLDVEDLGQSTE